MKTTRWMMMALALLAAGAAPAAEQSGAASTLLEYLEQRAAALNGLIERMRQTDDPAEQARLFQEHRRIMHQSMPRMREWMAGPAATPPGATDAPAGGDAGYGSRPCGMMGCGYPGMMSGGQRGMGPRGGRMMGPRGPGMMGGPGMRGRDMQMHEQVLQQLAAMEARISRLEQQVRRLGGEVR